MHRFFTLIILIAISIKLYPQNSDEKKDLNENCRLFLMYNTKVHGEFYGYGIQINNFIAEISYGGLLAKYGSSLGEGASMVNSSFNERYYSESLGIRLDESLSSYQRNFDFTLAFQNNKWKFLYYGLCYSNLTITYSESNDIGLEYRHASIDPLAGIQYNYKKFKFDLRIGFPLIKWSKFLDTSIFDNAIDEESSTLFVKGINESKSYVLDLLDTEIYPFSGLYIGVMVGYTINLD